MLYHDSLTLHLSLLCAQTLFMAILLTCDRRLMMSALYIYVCVIRYIMMSIHTRPSVAVLMYIKKKKHATYAP